MSGDAPRDAPIVQTRDIINEELEAIWAGKKTAQQGLDDAVARGNKLLRKFEKSQQVVASIRRLRTPPWVVSAADTDELPNGELKSCKDA